MHLLKPLPLHMEVNSQQDRFGIFLSAEWYFFRTKQIGKEIGSFKIINKTNSLAMENLEKILDKLEFLDLFLENTEIKKIRHQVFSEMYDKRLQTPAKDKNDVENLLKLRDKKSKLDKSFIISGFLLTKTRKQIKEYELMIKKMN